MDQWSLKLLLITYNAVGIIFCNAMLHLYCIRGLWFLVTQWNSGFRPSCGPADLWKMNAIFFMLLLLQIGSSAANPIEYWSREGTASVFYRKILTFVLTSYGGFSSALLLSIMFFIYQCVIIWLFSICHQNLHAYTSCTFPWSSMTNAVNLLNVKCCKQSVQSLSFINSITTNLCVRHTNILVKTFWTFLGT